MCIYLILNVFKTGVLIEFIHIKAGWYVASCRNESSVTKTIHIIIFKSIRNWSFFLTLNVFNRGQVVIRRRAVLQKTITRLGGAPYRSWSVLC